MQITSLDPSVLSVQGGIGSKSLGVANPGPQQGSSGGDAGNLTVIVDSPEVTAGAHGVSPKSSGGLAPKSGELLPK